MSHFSRQVFDYDLEEEMATQERRRRRRFVYDDEEYPEVRPRQSRRPDRVREPVRRPHDSDKLTPKASWILNGILGVCLLISLMQPLLSMVGYAALPVRTGSMAPRLDVGSIVLEKKTNHPSMSDITQGDIITFHEPTSPADIITHRFVSTEKADGTTYIRTKGDANGAVDGWRIQSTDVIGVYVAGVPKLGYVAAYMASWPVRLGIIAIVLVEIMTSNDSPSSQKARKGKTLGDLLRNRS